MRAIAKKQPSETSFQKKHLAAEHAPASPSHFSESSNNAPVLQCKPICPCGGGCPRCRGKLPIQTKLKIGKPGDKYEQEADRMAEQVLRMPEPGIQGKPT